MSFILPDIPELSPNSLAMPLVQQLMKDKERLKVNIHNKEGVNIIDCGVNVSGGWAAGVLFARICMGGLSHVDVRRADYKGFNWPSIEVMTDHPIRACLLSQFAGWPIQTRGFFAMGSGPGRAVAEAEELFEELGSDRHSEIAILCLEGDKLPTGEVLLDILKQCQCEPAKTYILVAPTASLVGSIQIAARALETGIYKLKALSFDITSIQSGWGICPLPPVGANGIEALGRTNDAIRYGATVYFNVESEDKTLAEIINKVPSSASIEYERSFAEIYKQYETFYDIDPLLFGPAEIVLTNLKSGRTFQAGEVAPDLLRASFGVE